MRAWIYAGIPAPFEQEPQLCWESGEHVVEADAGDENSHVAALVTYVSNGRDIGQAIVHFNLDPVCAVGHDVE